MKLKEMEIFNKHIDTYLSQEEPTVLHPVVVNPYHIDVLVYKPTENLPFWNLVTMGASDYKMPKIANTIGMYNEYIMFVDPEVDLKDKETVNWFYNKLVLVASYAYNTDTHITYGHSLEWENEDPDDEMIGAYIELPQVIPNPAVLRCKLGLLKTVACLQVVLLNKNNLEHLKQVGPQAFSEYLYPEDGGKAHFICERHRSGKF